MIYTTPTARVRSRVTAAMFLATALMNAAMAATSAVSTLIAADRLGAAWGSIPNTVAIMGTGIGAVVLSKMINVRGSRAGLLYGYAAAAGGAVLAMAATAGQDIIGLTIGMLLIGLGNAGAQLSRYVAADLYPPHKRGSAVGIVVWGSTLGAVGGPLLLAPSSTAAGGLGWPGFVGPFMLALAVTAGAMAVVSITPGRTPRRAESSESLRRLLRGPVTRSAFMVMVTAQVMMVAVMTATPLDMHLHGHGLDGVGAVLAVHTLGMFALSPITGRLVDRLGARPVMSAGLVVLAVAALGAAVGGDGMMMRTAALFLLGYGWNLCFVGGSGAIAGELPDVDRTRIEGAIDAGVWGMAAVAGLASTIILASGGYGTLALAAAGLLVLPVAVLAHARRR